MEGRIMKRRALFFAVALAAFLQFEKPANGQNLLTNPGFNGSLSGWQTDNDPGGTSSYSSLDANAASDSGSAKITYSNTPQSLLIGVRYQNFAVSNPASYNISGKINVTQICSGCEAFLAIFFVNSSGSLTNVERIGLTTLTDGFQSVSKTFAVPVGATRALPALGLKAPGGTVTAYFDDVYFAVDSSAPIINSFIANPTSVPPNGLVTLTWQTTGADSITLDPFSFLPENPPPVDGSITDHPAVTTTYALTAYHHIFCAFLPCPQPQVTSTVRVLVVATPPTITNGPPPDGTVGVPYNFAYTSTGFPAFGVTTGALPPGLSLSSAGVISGTPTTAGTFIGTVRASNGAAPDATQAFSITIVAPAPRPIVTVSLLPAGMLQAQNKSGATDRFALTNAGTVATSITLTRNGSFFSQAPSSFTLAPGATQVVTLTALAEPAGDFQGSSIPSGGGVEAGLSVPVRLLSLAPPAGKVTATPSASRSEVSAPPDVNPIGSVTFTNHGTSPLQGILTSDSGWLIPEAGVLSIPPGGSGSADFSVDNSKRPDSADPLGSVSGKMTVSFLSGSSALRFPSPEDSSGSSNTSVVIVAVAVPPTGVEGVPPLSSTISAVYIPGVSSKAGESADVFLANLGSILNATSLKLFYTPSQTAGSAAVSTAVNTLPPNAPVSFANIVKSIFGKSLEVGTIQLRASAVDKISLQSVLLNTTSPLGSFGTAMPVFRSEQGVAAGSKLFLTGLRKDAGSRTDLYVQETSGSQATVQIDFYLPADGIVSTRTGVTIPAFGVSALSDVVPAGAVSAVVTNVAGSAGKVVATAITRDLASGDPAAVASVASASPMVIPLVVTGSDSSGATRTEVAVMNTSATPVSAVLTLTTTGGRHRAVSRGGAGSKGELAPSPTASKPIPLAPLETRVISDIGSFIGSSGTGSLTVAPSTGSVAVSSRIVTSAAGRSGTWGSSVSPVPVANAIRAGETRSIAGLGDTTAATIQAATPVTFRTRFGFVETAGADAVVHVTARFAFPAGVTEARGVVSRDFRVRAHEFVLEQDMIKAITSSLRDTELGDLTDVEIDFQVSSGSGAIVPFTWSTDNGSGDSIVRVQ
jgi:hypothetical protein